eukprot:2458130-Amphidinium_carterae.2
MQLALDSISQHPDPFDCLPAFTSDLFKGVTPRSSKKDCMLLDHVVESKSLKREWPCRGIQVSKPTLHFGVPTRTHITIHDVVSCRSELSFHCFANPRLGPLGKGPLRRLSGLAVTFAIPGKLCLQALVFLWSAQGALMARESVVTCKPVRHVRRTRAHSQVSPLQLIFLSKLYSVINFVRRFRSLCGLVATQSTGPAKLGHILTSLSICHSHATTAIPSLAFVQRNTDVVMLWIRRLFARSCYIAATKPQSSSPKSRELQAAQSESTPWPRSMANVTKASTPG